MGIIYIRKVYPLFSNKANCITFQFTLFTNNDTIFHSTMCQLQILHFMYNKLNTYNFTMEDSTSDHQAWQV